MNKVKNCFLTTLADTIKSTLFFILIHLTSAESFIKQAPKQNNNNKKHFSSTSMLNGFDPLYIHNNFTLGSISGVGAGAGAGAGGRG